MTGPWAHLQRATLETCEPDIAGWMAHPAETLSSLAYVVAALAVWWSSRHANLQLPARRLPGILMVIGLGSMLFHSSFAAAFQALDLAVVFLFTGYMLAAMLIHRDLVGRRHFMPAFLLLGVGGGSLPVLHLWLGFAGLAAEGLAVLWLGHRVAPGANGGDYRVALWLLLPGVLLLVLDHGQIGCVSGPLEHIVQPHVGWHLLSAASLFFFCRYELPLERRWSELCAV